MTVASLWKVLDAAGCARLVGDSFVPINTTSTDRNPWNYKKKENDIGPKALAIDLSIWICESLTSGAMDNGDSNPALSLVVSRTVRLLELGIKLIGVIEGKRRIRISENEEKFRKRRSGNAFWKACKDCETVLGLLGVPVVRAKAEGEALCALLNQKGVVDGVLSNDGDCLLFGASTVFTKFSLDNMSSSNIKRYDLDKLFAAVDEDQEVRNQAQRFKLSRQDLISFALLTGSDLAGPGLPNVGHKRAIRFIRKCKLSNPLKIETAALDDLKSWSRTAKAVDGGTWCEPVSDGEPTKKGPCCSRCMHHGTKAQHEKHGCEVCGTAPGEPCFEVTTEDRFHQHLRVKALEVEPAFDPKLVLDGYLRPNDMQLPLRLVGITSDTLSMDSPKLSELLELPLVVKGRSLSQSRDYLRRSVGRVLAKAEMLRGSEEPAQSVPCASRQKPVPKGIVKAMTQKNVPVFEILWLMQATVTDDEGKGLDEYEFSTVESHARVKKRFPDLVRAFEEAERERLKQGDAEQERRKAFLESILVGTNGGIPREAVSVKEPPNSIAGRLPRLDGMVKTAAEKAGFRETQSMIELEPVSWIKTVKHRVQKRSFAFHERYNDGDERVAKRPMRTVVLRRDRDSPNISPITMCSALYNCDRILSASLLIQTPDSKDRRPVEVGSEWSHPSLGRSHHKSFDFAGSWSDLSSMTKDRSLAGSIGRVRMPLNNAVNPSPTINILPGSQAIDSSTPKREHNAWKTHRSFVNESTCREQQFRASHTSRSGIESDQREIKQPTLLVEESHPVIPSISSESKLYCKLGSVLFEISPMVAAPTKQYHLGRRHGKSIW